MQLGDVKVTYADIDDHQQATGFKPSPTIYQGIKKFVESYMEYLS